MFVLVRSALCIGLVIAALPDRPVPDDPGLVEAAARPAMGALMRYCGSNPERCRLAVEATLDGARAPAAPGRKLRARPDAVADRT